MHYSVIKGYFRFKKLRRNRYITRYRVVKLCCMLDNIIICLYKHVDLASKFLVKMHARKQPPSYLFTSTPLKVSYKNNFFCDFFISFQNLFVVGVD